MPAQCLVNLDARIYDATVGRFMTPDTIVQDPYNGQAFNRFSYVANNPTSYTDRSGREIDPNNRMSWDPDYGCAIGCETLASNNMMANDLIKSLARGTEGAVGGQIGYLIVGVEPSRAASNSSGAGVTGNWEDPESSGVHIEGRDETVEVDARPSHFVIDTFGSSGDLSARSSSAGAAAGLAQSGTNGNCCLQFAANTPGPTFGGGVTVGGPGTAVPNSALPANTKQVLQGRRLNPDGTVTIFVPEGYIPTPAQNNQGIVFLPPGQTLGDNGNIIRWGDPNAYNPYDYLRVYNAAGQPINVYSGQPLSNDQTHFQILHMDIKTGP